MSDQQKHRVVYVSHPGSGLARSNFPMVCHLDGAKIVRSLPFHIPDDVRLYEIKTSRGVYKRPRKDVQMPLAYAWKQRVHSATRVRYPLLRNDWSPDNPTPQKRGASG
jgi:hypothetical protein